MLFSVIVPIYNVAPFLRQCIDSVICQKTEFEVILVDDGSTDGSGLICDEYAEKYCFIKVIHQKNQGLAGARNTGLENASGDWIVFLDSDDWLEYNTLSVLEKYMIAHPAEMYCFNMQRNAEDGSVGEKIIFFPENGTIKLMDEEQRFCFFFEEFMQYHIGWEVCTRVFSREILEKSKLRFRPTQEVFAEDYLFTFQYLLRIRKIGMICNLLYHYRQRSASLLNAKKVETVLPRLNNWAEIAYEDVRSMRLHKFRKDFYLLYFALINYHIQYPLRELSDKRLKKILESMNSSRRHQMWMKKIRRADFTKKYMVERTWL